MKIKNAIFLMVSLSIFCINSIWSDDVTAGFDQAKTLYRQGIYRNSIMTGINALNNISLKLEQSLLSNIPDISNSVWIETNDFYSISGGNEIADFSMQVEKVYSNPSAYISLTLDTSLNNVLRINNLMKSYEYLTEKGNYKKLKIKIRKDEIEYLTESSNTYVVYPFEIKEDEVVSGLMLKMSVNFITNIKASERDKQNETYLKEVLEKMRTRELNQLLK